MAAGRGRLFFVAVAVCLGLVACEKKDRQKTPPGPPPFTEVEVERGRKACSSYVERVCRCRTVITEAGGESCDLARGRESALSLALDAVAASEKRPDVERWAIIENARRIIAGCVEADLELDPGLCSRASTGSPSP